MDKLSFIPVFLWVMAILAGLYGYVANIVILVNSIDTAGAGEIVARIAGIILPILGAILGYV